MSSLGYCLLMLTRVTLAFLVLYLLVPTLLSRSEPPASGIWDRMFAGLIHVTFLTIILVYVLVFSRLYETFSLLFAYALTLVWLHRRRGNSPTKTADKIAAGLLARGLDISEDREGAWHGFSSAAKQKLAIWTKNTATRWKRLLFDPFLFLFPGTVIVWSAFIRLRYAIYHASYSVSDPYEHLAWVKYLGTNQIFRDGIYPEGYHAIISAMAKLTFIDPYWMIRFMGGLGTTLLVVSIYHFTLRVTKDHGASLVALAVYGLVSDARFPSMLYRQQAALPQEYALIFGLPALYFLTLYLKEHRRSHLLLFVEAVAVTLFIHPYTTLYLLIWAAIQVAFSFCFRQVTLRQIGRIVLYGIPATAIGVLPYAIGLVSGKTWFGAAFDFVRSNIGQAGLAPAGSWWLRLISGNPYLDVLLPVCLIAVLTALLPKYENKLIALTTAASAVVMMLLYRAAELGLPQLSDSSRTAVFLAPFLAISCGFGTQGIAQLVFAGVKKNHHRWVASLTRVIALCTCLSIVIYAMPALPPVYTVEYDAAAEAYLRIEADLPYSDWTIVAPSEQYQQAVGIGWQYELLRFVQDFDLTEADDPTFQLPIPTHNIFVFVEKRSLLDQQDTLAVDADAQLAPEGPDPYTEYYRSASQRALLEAKISRWMEHYLKSHSGVSIYYEDENLRIYQIVHELPPK